MAHRFEITEPVWHGPGTGVGGVALRPLCIVGIPRGAIHLSLLVNAFTKSIIPSITPVS